MKQIILFAASCTLLPVAWIALALDNWAGASRNLFFEVCFISTGILVGALVRRCGNHRGLLFVPCAYILFMIALPFMDLSPVKLAVRAVRQIHPGMTESQVRGVLERNFPERSRFARPAFGPLHENVLAFVLDRNDGRYNAAVVQIRFAAGKCASAEFLPD